MHTYKNSFPPSKWYLESEKICCGLEQVLTLPYGDIKLNISLLKIKKHNFNSQSPVVNEIVDSIAYWTIINEIPTRDSLSYVDISIEWWLN
jgi:hypothetical protein